MKTDNLLIIFGMVVAICIVAAAAFHDYIDHLNHKAATCPAPTQDHQSSTQPVVPLT